MTTAKYLDRLLTRYSGTFNIYKNYKALEEEYSAYGYFYSHIEKYVLTRDVNLWASNSYEHIFFMELDTCTHDDIDKIERLFREYVEPNLVRHGQEVPDKNHMYSYLTAVILVNKDIDDNIKKRIKKFKFEKGYQFNIRGFSQGRIIAATMNTQEIITNYYARQSKKLYKSIFTDIEEGKIGFEELCTKQDIEAFVQ